MASLKDDKLTYEGTTWELDLATVHNWISELAPWLLVAVLGYVIVKYILDRKNSKEIITRQDFESYKDHLDEKIDRLNSKVNDLIEKFNDFRVEAVKMATINKEKNNG